MSDDHSDSGSTSAVPEAFRGRKNGNGYISLTTLFAVTRIDDWTYESSYPAYSPGNGVRSFGGHFFAQAVVAAAETVNPGFVVHVSRSIRSTCLPSHLGGRTQVKLGGCLVDGTLTEHIWPVLAGWIHQRSVCLQNQCGPRWWRVYPTTGGRVSTINQGNHLYSGHIIQEVGAFSGHARDGIEVRAALPRSAEGQATREFPGSPWCRFAVASPPKSSFCCSRN
jgi:hypothetical protein